jgi:hypothetical protein
MMKIAGRIKWLTGPRVFGYPSGPKAETKWHVVGPMDKDTAEPVSKYGLGY